MYRENAKLESSTLDFKPKRRRRAEGLTGTGGAVGVVAGVRAGPVAPQAGVALAVGARRVARGAAELRRAAAGADGTLPRKEPTSHCRIKRQRITRLLFWVFFLSEFLDSHWE